ALGLPNSALIPAHAAPKKRAKLWELTPMLHCSVVGTCLMSGELRSLLRRCGALPGGGQSDHELHEIAVSAASRRDETAKEIHKALDQRHKLAIARFSKTGSTEELRTLWDDAVAGGDIAGAYWALLTHPLCDDRSAHHAFGDIHMLSHVVGSANRVA